VAPDVAAVAAVSGGSQNLTAAAQWTFAGVRHQPVWLNVRSRTLTAGRFINDADVANSAQ